MTIPSFGDQAPGAVLEHLEVTLDPLAAGSQTLAATSPPEPVTPHPHRIGPLQGFDRRVFRIRHPGVDAVLAGAGGAGPLAAGDGLVVDPALAADEEVVHRALAGAGYPVGAGQGQ